MHAEMQKGTQAGLVVLFELEKKQLLQQVQVVELRIEIEQRCLEESSPSEDYLFSYEQHTNQLSDELLQMAQLQYLLNTEITFLRGFLTSIDAVDDSGNIKTLLLNMDERYFPLFKSEETRSNRPSLVEIKTKQEAWQPFRRKTLLRHELRLQRIAAGKQLEKLRSLPRLQDDAACHALHQELQSSRAEIQQRLTNCGTMMSLKMN